MTEEKQILLRLMRQDDLDADELNRRMDRQMRPWNRLRFAIKRRRNLASLLAQRDEVRAEFVQKREPFMRDVIRELDRDIASARNALSRERLSAYMTGRM